MANPTRARRFVLHQAFLGRPATHTNRPFVTNIRITNSHFVRVDLGHLALHKMWRKRKALDDGNGMLVTMALGSSLLKFQGSWGKAKTVFRYPDPQNVNDFEFQVHSLTVL